MYLRASMYYPFIKDWMDVFTPKQMMVVKGEDYYSNRTHVLNSISDFLDLRKLAMITYLFVAKSLMVLMLNAAFNKSASPSLIP